MMLCWKCHKAVSTEPMKIGFRAVCPHCDRDLHVCVNCRHYAPGKPNECNIPGTDYVKDREVMNYCEEFTVKPPIVASNKEDPKNHFNSLFKDE